ncbi:MAG: 50S ribosomal protein L40e [archaeon]
MAKIPEATERMFHNIFVCKKCKTKMRTSSMKVITRKTTCRKCGGKNFRAIKKGKAK